jgi:hypothetical protein
MMKRIAVCGLCLAAICAMAAAAAPASAVTTGWKVNGTLLNGTVALATTAAVDKKYVLNGGGLDIECEGSVLEATSPQLVSPNKLKDTALTFTGCTTTNANCAVPARIGTVPVEAEATQEGVLAARATFKPQTGTTFATIKYSGELCAVAGVKALSGDANTSLSTGRDERTLQLDEVNVTTAQNLLFFAGNAAGLTGTALLRLENGKPWSWSGEAEKEKEKEKGGPAGWMTSGTLLTGTAALATTAAVDKKYVVNGAGLNLECNGSVIKFAVPELVAASKLEAAALTFTGCTTTNANCVVPAELGTVPIQAEATLEGALAAKATFKPQTGSTFVTMKFSGEACAVAGVKTITGDANMTLASGQDERTLQLLEANVTAAQNLLFFIGSAASLTGSALLRLASGQPWSFL